MIECQDLSKKFNSFWAVDGLSFQVAPGQVLALLGQNGAGKTTTVRLLSSVLTPSRGWAKIAGHDVVSEPAKVRASIGVLTESHGLYGRMTAEEYLEFFGQVYGLSAETRKQRSKFFLEYFGLALAAAQRTGEYSKGMRQKLALARALLHEPPALLLDEPTSAMDPESARLVREHIAGLRSSQRTIILCTHNLVEAEQLADYLAIIYKGKLLVQGSFAELKDGVLGAPEYELQTAAPWQPEGFHLPSGVSLQGGENKSWRFKVQNPQSENPAFMKALAVAKIPIVAFQEIPRSLEQIYLKVMQQANGGASEL